MKTNKTTEPILVQNPQTKQQYNVGPLVAFLNNHFEGSIRDLSDTLCDYLIEISMMEHSPAMEGDEFRDMLFTLADLKDALKIMDHVPISVQAPGNGQLVEYGKEARHGR